MEKVPVTNSENSAALLSVWHIVFSRFFSKCENKYLNKKCEGLMEEIYANLKTIRLTIFEAKTETIDPKITRPFEELFNIVPQSRWIEEINSMMKEVKQSKTDLSILKEYYSQFPEVNSSQFEMDLKNKEQLTHLITVWYWLTTVWSSANQPENDDVLRFVEGVENKHSSINKALFYRGISADETQQRDIADLMSKLFDMFRSNPQRWLDAIDTFMFIMMQVGFGYKYVQETRQPSIMPPFVTMFGWGSVLSVAIKFAKAAAKAAAGALGWEIGKEVANQTEVGNKVVNAVLGKASIVLMSNVDTAVDNIDNLALTAGQGMQTFVEEIK